MKTIEERAMALAPHLTFCERVGLHYLNGFRGDANFALANKFGPDGWLSPLVQSGIAFCTPYECGLTDLGRAVVAFLGTSASEGAA